MTEGNFAFLTEQEPQLARLASLAERYWPDDANTALMKTRQFAELLAQNVAARTGLLLVPGEGQLQLLERLTREAVVPPDAARLFHEIRKSGNRANHSPERQFRENVARPREAGEGALTTFISFGHRPLGTVECRWVQPFRHLLTA